MKKTLLLFTLLSFLVASQAVGQSRTIRGKVTSSDDNQGLPGVNVVIQGTTKGAVTDMNGDYTLELGADEIVLSFTFVGYKTQTVEVGQREVINVILESDATALEEVVVIGYGTVRKSDLTGSVSSVRGTDITKVPSFNPVQALQGKVAGLQVTSTSGAPGASAVVRVRGTGTFNNSSPIYVVDGVILDNIDFLSSGDIKSMEVLKDASATAIYGSRGANGVILVTTKLGTEGEPVINFSAEYSIQQLQNPIELLNGKEFALYVNEFDPTYNNPDAVPNTDWQDLIYSSAPISNYQLSVSGASDKVQYYFGLGYFNQEGIIDKSSYERISLKFNNTYKVSKNVRFGNNITFTPYKQQNTNGNAVFAVYRAWPTLEPYRADPDNSVLGGIYTPVPGVGNPLADIEFTNSFDEGMRTVGNIFGEIDIIKGLTFRSSFGADITNRKNKSFTPAFEVNSLQANAENDLTKNFVERTSWLWENTLTYSKEIGNHRFDVLAGYTAQDVTSEFASIKAENLIRDDENFWYYNPSTINPTGISDPNGVEINDYYAILSYLFRVNYIFKDKYLITGTFRRDGSSKFSEENQYGNFPSLAFGWNIMEEGFAKNSLSTIFTNLKFRASWGIVGNEKIAYDKRFSQVANGVSAVFNVGDVLFPGATYGATGNPDLKWETTHQTDIGLEAGFFNNRLTVELDYYNKQTKDILVPLEVPGYLGNGSEKITYNAADASNKGMEFNVAYTGEIASLTYRVGAVGSTIKNKVENIIKANGSQGEIFGDEQLTRSYQGSEIGAFYGYEVNGIFQNQSELDAYPHDDNSGIGDLRFVDVNNDGQIDPNDRTTIGSPIPNFIYGFNAELMYKGFDFSIDFQGQSGNEILNYKETVRPDLYNFEATVQDYWRGEGTSNTVPQPSQGGINYRISTRFIQDGSFLRLRTISLGYTLPSELTQKVYMKAVRVYARATNLFTISDFTGYTPEIGADSPINNAIDRGTYPVPAIYSLGLNLTF